MAAGDIKIIQEVSGGNFTEITIPSNTPGYITIDQSGNLTVSSLYNSKVIHNLESLEIDPDIADIFVFEAMDNDNYFISFTNELQEGKEISIMIINSSGGDFTLYLPNDEDYSINNAIQIERDTVLETSVVNINSKRFWQGTQTLRNWQ